MKQKFLDISNFSAGLRVLEEETNAPVGSCREMVNFIITDRGGISKRLGSILLGSTSNDTYGSVGFYSFNKANGDEIPLRAYDDEVEYYHPTAGWSRLQNGFTSSAVFGFTEHNINRDSEDYIYFGNQKDDMRRWHGNSAVIATALTSGSTSVVVDSLLYDDVFYSGTATVGNSSSLDVGTTGTFAVDQWNENFYVHFTTGGAVNRISQITDTFTSGLEFNAMSSAVGAVSFEIRKPAFSSGVSLMIGGNTRTYTALSHYNTFQTSTGISATTGTAVTELPESIKTAPKGNRFAVKDTRLWVGNVETALVKNASSSVVGDMAMDSVFVSSVLDGSNFALTAPRAAGDPDCFSISEGKGNITDIVTLEDNVYVFKKNHIEAVQYTQDSSDIVQKTPISSELGAVNKAIRGKNDIYFVTTDNQISSLGRVANKDVKQQATNIGYPIKRLLSQYSFADITGIRFENRLMIGCKSLSTETKNNKILVYNEERGCFEGIWNFNAGDFSIYEGNLYCANSRNQHIHRLFYGTDDIVGPTTYEISAVWRSNWINLTPSKVAYQGLHGIAVEGFITDNTTLTFDIYKDFNTDSALEFTYTGGASSVTVVSDGFSADVPIGFSPLGTTPMGAFPDATSAAGLQRFSFIYWFPFQYGNNFSIGISNAGKNQNFEITRLALAISEDTDYNNNSIKTA